jgi:putative glutamine amidotransferase
MPSSQAPIICVTLRNKPAVEARRDPTPYAYEWLPSAYAEAVVRAGGALLYLSNYTPADMVPDIVKQTNGLFLTGGEDVAPEYYNETDQVGNIEVNDLRDQVELAAIAAADKLELPILGICRGVQVLNVARGGTLVQDLDLQWPGAPRDHSRGGTGHFVQTHDVEVAAGCRLERVLGASRFAAATSHHQAVKDPGRGLAVVARSPEDGVIEAVEGTGNRFVVGVQWHPEVRAQDETTVNLFKAFVEAAAEYRRRHAASA